LQVWAEVKLELLRREAASASHHASDSATVSTSEGGGVSPKSGATKTMKLEDQEPILLEGIPKACAGLEAELDGNGKAEIQASVEMQTGTEQLRKLC
jgi:hypothetical protein